MGDVTKIQWAHHTFNPWRGCQHASLPSGRENPACANCYAEAMSRRNPKTLGHWGDSEAGGTRVLASEQQWLLPRKWNAAAEKAGERRRVFVNSLSDFFEAWTGLIHDHRGVPLRACQCGAMGTIHEEWRGSFWEQGYEFWQVPRRGR